MSKPEPHEDGMLQTTASWPYWVVLAVMILAEWLVFRAYYLREVAASFPRMFDQLTYLAQSYDIFERIRHDGLIRGAVGSFAGASANGFLLPYEAAFAYFLATPSRLTAITVNFVHLAALQIVILAVGSWAKRPGAALAIAGAILTAGSIYQQAGGLQDFRIDFAAFCLFAILGLVVIRSSGFRSRPWTFVVGIVTIIVVLTRTIQLTYLSLTAVQLILLAIFLRRRDPACAERIRNLVLSGVPVVAVLAIYVIVMWERIVGYYVVAQSSEIELRALQFPASSLLEHLLYYPKSAVSDHAGGLFVVLSALLVSIYSRPRRSNTRAVPRADSEGTTNRYDVLWSAAFAASAIISAYVVLTANITRSPVVGGVFIAAAIPLLWMVACYGSRGAQTNWAKAVYAVVITIGLSAFVVAHMRVAPGGLNRAEVSQHLAMIDYMSRTSAQLGMAQPVISFDEVAEYFHVLLVKVLAFERFGQQLTPIFGLGASLAAVSRDQAMTQLASSDFAVLGSPGSRPNDLTYPGNRSVYELLPDLYAWAAVHMVPVMEASFFGRRVTLFVRPSVVCKGNQGGWITSDGIECSVLADVLRSRPVIELSGNAPLKYLPGSPNAIVDATLEGEPLQESTCEFSAVSETPDNSRYTVRCTASAPVSSHGDFVRFQIRFDRYFVPKDSGINDDPRQLVVPWPIAATVQASGG